MSKNTKAKKNIVSKNTKCMLKVSKKKTNGKPELPKIKPCPWCANCNMGIAYHFDESVTVTCIKCGMHGPTALSEPTAIEKYNRWIG